MRRVRWEGERGVRGDVDLVWLGCLVSPCLCLEVGQSGGARGRRGAAYSHKRTAGKRWCYTGKHGGNGHVS